MRRPLLAAWVGLLVLAAANWTIYSRERHLTHGEIVLLELAPVDPRSLMQGDYMALRFQVETDAFGFRPGLAPADGHLVVRLDERGVATYLRHQDGETDGAPLPADQRLLRYRVRDGRVRFATDAFFFQEGTADVYENARYGEFRVTPAGDLLLTHLRSATLERLGTRGEQHAAASSN